jgi:hypothetical protein
MKRVIGCEYDRSNLYACMKIESEVCYDCCNRERDLMREIKRENLIQVYYMDL